MSDLHVGSPLGLAPPSMPTGGYGNTVGYGTNTYQQWLWTCWQDFLDRFETWAKRNRRNVGLVVNGDCTEGIHHRSKEVTAADIEHHAIGAITVLKPLRDLCHRAWFTLGTECHTQGIENYIAKELEADGNAAHPEVNLRVNGCLVNAKHHIGPTSRAYLEASGLGINMGNARLNALRADHPAASVFCRAHRHCGGWYSDGKSMMVVTGGWQGLTRHGWKVVPDSISIPTIAILDWKDRREGELPRADQYRYQPPAPQITVA